MVSVQAVEVDVVIIVRTKQRLQSDELLSFVIAAGLCASRVALIADITKMIRLSLYAMPAMIHKVCQLLLPDAHPLGIHVDVRGLHVAQFVLTLEAGLAQVRRACRGQR